MFRKLVTCALGTSLFFSTAAYPEGTAADAKAMLEKTVAAIKQDKAKALDEIHKGENGFLVGDIYPVCFNLDDGALVADGNPNEKRSLGKDVGLTNPLLYGAMYSVPPPKYLIIQVPAIETAGSHRAQLRPGW